MARLSFIKAVLLLLSFVLFGPTVSYAAVTATAEEHFSKAMELRFAGESKAAVSEYQAGLVLKPNAVDARAQMATVLLDEVGDLDGAISEFMTALNSDPNCKFCELELKRALNIRNSKSADQITRGNQFYASGDLRRASAAYRVAIYLDPGDGNAHNSLAWTFYRLGNLQEGLKEVQEALHVKPDDPEFVNTLACLQFDKGDLSAAAKYFHKAIALSKTPNAADLYGLAVVAITRGDTTGASKFFKEALKIDPKYDDVVYLRDRIGLSANTLSCHDRLLALMKK